jgi:myo-inositol-1(or 4)-monophosphatase
MHPADVADLRRLAAELAHQAGSVAHEGRRAARDAGVSGATKSSATDIVTEYDRAAEATIVEALQRLRPADAIVGEEGTALDGTSGYAWYIDPIDGTTNFVYDLPMWSCSVGVSYRAPGEPDRSETMIAGAVYAPALDELYSAGTGQGATLNGEPIHASTETELGLALVATGFSYRAAARTEQAARISRIISSVRDIRRMGSAAVDLCFLAAGRVDVYFEQYLNPWDAAAGELIAREAGALTSDFGGGPARPGELLAAAPGLHLAFVELLAEVATGGGGRP